MDIWIISIYFVYDEYVCFEHLHASLFLFLFFYFFHLFLLVGG